MTERKRVLIVGGVAGGASAATRLRRLDERAEIIVFDRGPHVSFANCGLPYYVGNVIHDEGALLVASAELFRARFNIEVRTLSEATAIDRTAQKLAVHDLASGRRYAEPYDALVLAPGARPVRPPLPGIDLDGIFAIRTIPDTRKVRTWMADKGARRAVVVGAGFIGLEMAENLAHRHLEVTILEAAPQVMPPLDPELAWAVEEHLRAKGLRIHVGDPVTRFTQNRQDGQDELQVHTRSGSILPADLVILAMGVEPETALAKTAGLDLGPRGIRVDARMRTSDPRIWAVGDVVEVPSVISGTPTVAPLAGPAQRQGRVAADAICGRDVRFRGVQSTSVCGAFGLTIASTGASEKGLRAAGAEGWQKVHLHPGHHAGYYPGARPIHLKLLFSNGDGRVLGAQAVGEAGVEKRIDVISMAIQQRATVYDLEEAELCYAPQYGAAKDPVNLAGMVAANVLRGDVPLAHWEDLGTTGAYVVDVRSKEEYLEQHIPGAVNLPLTELRERLDELPCDRPVWVYCGVGQRAYYATRLLAQHGIPVRNLTGGIQTWRQITRRRRA